MERRTAIALSVSTAITTALGGLAFATLSGMDLLGFGPVESSPTPVLVNPSSSAPTTTVDETPVVVTTVAGADPTATVATVPGPAVGGNSSANTPRIYVPAPPATVTPTNPSSGGISPTTTAAPSSPPAVVSVPPSVPQTPATTAPPPAPSTTVAAPSNPLPPGVRIPSDWPPDKPIPPIPAGCQSPQLEDNGVWNCQH